MNGACGGAVTPNYSNIGISGLFGENCPKFLCWVLIVINDTNFLTKYHAESPEKSLTTTRARNKEDILSR